MNVQIASWMLPPLFDLGLQTVLRTQPHWQYLGMYTDVETFVNDMGDDPETVRIVVADYQQAYPGYPALLSVMRQHFENLRVLFVLPLTTDESVLVSALRSGGDGYVTQAVHSDSFIDAIEELSQGRAYIHPALTPAVLDELRKPLRALQEWDVHVQLTDRERLLIQLVADGLSNVQIGQMLGLAEKTVRNLWSSLFDKVGYNDRTQVVMWAIRTGQAELR